MLACLHEERFQDCSSKCLHPTATLFAALDTFDGTLISMCDDRHRRQEWLKFLRVIDQVPPPEKDLPDRR